MIIQGNITHSFQSPVVRALLIVIAGGLLYVLWREVRKIPAKLLADLMKAGRVEFKVDKGGNVDVAVGKISFAPNQIEENARAVIEAVAKSRPSSVKGLFIHTCTLSATMSPPVRVDLREFMASAA